MTPDERHQDSVNAPVLPGISASGQAKSAHCSVRSLSTKSTEVAAAVNVSRAIRSFGTAIREIHATFQHSSVTSETVPERTQDTLRPVESMQTSEVYRRLVSQQLLHDAGKGRHVGVNRPARGRLSPLFIVHHRCQAVLQEREVMKRVRHG